MHFLITLACFGEYPVESFVSQPPQCDVTGFVLIIAWQYLGGLGLREV